MVGAIVSRYFFDVRLFHPHLHAGFSRRFRSSRRCLGHRLSARRVSVPRRDSRGPGPAPTSSPRRGEERYRQAPGMDCALNGRLRASPSDPPTQAPLGVGCVQHPSHEHERPAPRLRVRPFPAISDPAGNTTSADFSTASDTLTSIAVPHHPANQTDGASGTPAEISASKTSNLHRTPTAFTERPLDGIGLRLVVQTRPDRPAFYAQHAEDPDAPCVPRVATAHSGFLPTQPHD